MSLRIERWRGQPDVVERLADWHVRQWKAIFPGWDEAAAVDEFNLQLRHDGLPATWLAYLDDELVGSISALLEDSPELTDIPGPWMASFYIRPEARRNGAAPALMAAAADGVTALGYAEWFLFTEFHEDYYRRFGWSVLERRELHGQTVSIMRQRLPR